ncbi:Telomerase-binding protein EST1A [Taenia solium]|eukprot:TsM_000919000 transcript=TsM_000919000 gene=TsM_000919000
MVPPGSCTSHIPPLPDEKSEDKLRMSESERLFLRWWATLENLRGSLMVNYERIILEDLDFCNTAQIEQGMWKSVFYTVLEFLRSWVVNPYLTGLLPKPEEGESGQAVAAAACSRMIKLIRKVCLEDVIRVGEHRLTALLNRLQEVRHVHLEYVLSEGRPPPESGSRSCKLMYISAQKLMLYLGDLARYEEIINGGQNFGKARSWYQKAQLLIPKSGRPYHQLALLAVYTSRHFDAMCYYMRSLAASNPFPTASQSLSALFNDVHTHGAEFLQKKSSSSRWLSGCPSSQTGPSCNHAPNVFTHGRPKRVEIWIHPVNGTATIVQGNRSLTVAHFSTGTGALSNSKKAVGTANSPSLPSDEPLDDENEEEGEEAQADAEEYANMSLIELTKLFGLHFMHAHGQLFTKIGMEAFPEVASMALQALSGLLAQRPCPLSEDRLCQILMVNMFNLDRAAMFTAQSAVSMVAATERSNNGVAEAGRRQQQQQLLQRKPKVESETLRSVHHDHAARFALDTFSLICRRAARLFTESRPESRTSGNWLHPDLRILLPALRLWTEWMVLHPEHWSPPPNHRDPTLRPCLDDWRLVAEMCTHAARWFAGVKDAPSVQEITPSTALVVQLHLRKHRVEADGDGSDAAAEDSANQIPAFLKYTTLFEETVCAGFKPMLDLIPKMYQYTGDWDAGSVAHYIRIEKILLFGDFLCGIEPPVLSYDVDKAIYEPVVERESCEQAPIKKPTSCHPNDSESLTDSDDESETDSQTGSKSATTALKVEEEGIEENEGGEEICALRRRRAVLRSQLMEARRLEAWRQQAVRQAAAGGPRGIEIEVRPVYILPDTNCYIDWLEGVARLTQASSNYTVLVPIVVFNELDYLASQDRAFAFNSIETTFAQYLTNPSSTTSDINSVGGGRANLIQERAKAAIAFLEGEFNHRNPRLRALTAKGSMLETIAYRNEVNGGKQPGQINDDVILTCCRRFCKEVLAQMSAEGNLVSTAESKNQPMRVTREVVLLTSDRNLRLKALSLNIPARPLRPFVEWSCLKPVDVLAVSSPSSDEVDPPLSAHTSSGRWKNRKHPKQI